MILKKFINANYSNYQKSICEIFYPKNYSDINKIINYAKKKNKKILPIGSGLSWFDTIFNTDNIIIDLKKFEKKFFFDKKKGELTVSSQFKISEILNIINQSGWSLYSIPGGGDVCVGGCIGNDVHGKDSFKYGNFSESIIELEAILPSKSKIKCSKKKNDEIFNALCGGLGLIGIITKVRLKLKPIAKYYETISIPCNNYLELIKNIYTNTKEYDYIYAWLDIFAKKNNLGKSVIFKSKKIQKKISSPLKINNFTIFKKIQEFIFSYCVKNNFTKYINKLIFFLFKLDKKTIESYREISFPLSSYGVDIKKIINPYSFFEIQILIKRKNIKKDLKNFILKCQKLKLSGFVIGVKRHLKNNNLLSFSDDGISININQIFNSKKNFSSEKNKIKMLHDYVIKKKHKIYICKDFFLNKKKIKLNYPNFIKFLKIKKKYDKENVLSSDFFQRIS